MSTVKIRRSGTASSTPASLDHGELAINYADDTLFWKDSANVIRSFVFQSYASATHASTHATGGSDALSPSDIGAAPAASPAITGNATFEASSGVPLTVTNTGTGNSFVVNDASGDTTPFVVDSAGIVGIQNANPQSVIFQGLLVGAGTGNIGITLLSSAANNGTVAFGDDTTGNGSYRGYVQYQHSVDAMVIGSAAATRIFINSSGNVGIGTGTSTPASRLDVNGVITVSATSGSAGSYAPSLTFSGDANTGFGQVSGQSDTASIFTAGHERVRVDSSGRVGIGNSSMQLFNASFDDLVVGSGGTHHGITVFSTAQGLIAFGDTASDAADGFRGFVGYTHATDSLFFGANGGTRMLVHGSGNVGIGTGSSTPASRLEVSGVITVSATAGSAGSYAPSLTFSGDPNTGFGQVSGQSDTASIFTAGHERVRVDASGRLLVGATSGRNLGGFTPSLIEGTDANGSRLAVVQNTNNTAGAGINLCKSRGTSVGSVTIVQSGDTLGSVFFNGADGTDLSSVGASVSAQVDGTPAANDLPGRLVFSTTASGSQTPTERVRIKSTGAVRFVPLSADPASGEAGDVYYNSSTNKLRVYNGTSWIDLH